ncbi:hypothetical protein BJ170DRAFT_573393 [Xylariales sp. AK1849]|nr:hypothetical protein BJ170DRAFT_573393 [Xylariales sp. AK1849]
MAIPTEDLSQLFVGDDEEVEDNDDNISLTSSLESVHDETEEFVVDAILAERPNQDPDQEGDTQYLIKWENYAMDRCTWESIGNLSEELQQQWSEQKEEEEAGLRRPFDIRIYEDAIADAVRGKAARHIARNDKRQRFGLFLTEPIYSHTYETSSVFIASKEESTSSDEAMEVDEIEPGRVTKVATETRIKQNIFKRVPSPKPAPTTTQPSQGKFPESGRGAAGSPVDSVGKSKGIGKTSSTTGWQGTARKPSASEKTQTQTQAQTQTQTSRKSTVAARTPLLTRSAVTGQAPVVLKARKRRSNLKDAMMDSSKAPKLMSNLRRVNQLKKKAMELNDAAPEDPSAIPAAYFITKEPIRGQSRDQSRDQPSRNASFENSNADTNQAQSSIIPRTGLKKDRKGLSVRFMENSADSLFDEPMNIDSPTTPVEIWDSVTTPSSASKKVSLQTYHGRAVTQAVLKSASFGHEGSKEVHVIFNGIPKAGDKWLPLFLADKILHFRRICTSEDILSTTLYNPLEKLASGKLESLTDPMALDAVTSNLRRSSAGFYLAAEEYSILVYPGLCSAWERLTNSTSPSDVAARYVVFRTTPPLTLGHYPPLSVAAIDQTDGGPNSALLCAKLMKEIADLDYNVLQPASKNNKHVFFLLFYPSELFLQSSMVLWLRACKPDCQVFCNSEAGGWKAYQKETSAGAVILHEFVVKSVRKIPRLWDMLKHGNHTFWSLSSSDEETPLRPATTEEVPNVPITPRVPAQLKMTRLFPHGRAFLITPSFAISQPAELCQFLEWFQARSKYAPCVLVVCAGFIKYLLDLIVEKAEERNELRQRIPGFAFDETASSAGLSSDDLKYRTRAWEIMSGIDGATRHGVATGEPPEDLCKIVAVDDLIAPDDEQSLLNWFASWSTIRLDCYRKFYVLGSNANGIRKAYRMVRIPNYTEDTINHPGKAFAASPQEQGRSNDVSSTSEPYVFRSSMFNTDKASDLQAWIMYCISNMTASWAKIYRQPISWLDISMADQFQDPKLTYATYKSWFYGGPQFSRGINTMIGLFYTVDGDWNGTNQASLTRRHPWIAVYRPMNPHYTSHDYSRMELLIWDCAAKDRWPGEVSKELLLPMQQRLVEFVRQEAPKRSAGHHLQRVFVGGWNTEVNVKSPYPIDVTCRMIELFLGDARSQLPPWDKLLLERGWKFLSDGQGNPVTFSGPMTMGVTTSTIPSKVEVFPKNKADLGQPERIIFHPASGTSLANSACTNDLHHAALRARRSDPNCTVFEYQYRTTLDWYEDLKKEKRAYSHMNVDSWDMVFDDIILRPRK